MKAAEKTHGRAGPVVFVGADALPLAATPFLVWALIPKKPGDGKNAQ